MIHQIFVHTEFSLLPRGLGHFAERNGIPKSLTTTFHPVLIVAIPLMSLLSLFVRLFQRCHLSRIDEVLKCGDSMVQLHMLSQIPIELSVYTTFGTCDGPTNFNKLFFRLVGRFCFARIRLTPMSGKILYHDSVPMIVSGFTSLIEDFVR